MSAPNDAEKVVILDLTDETHGNAQGVGLADVTTRRLVNKTKLEMTYPTAVTNTFLHLMKIPMIMDNDREALQLALCCCPEAEDQEHKNRGSRGQDSVLSFFSASHIIWTVKAAPTGRTENHDEQTGDPGGVP